MTAQAALLAAILALPGCGGSASSDKAGAPSRQLVLAI
jgi:hypothetical protein